MINTYQNYIYTNLVSVPDMCRIRGRHEDDANARSIDNSLSGGYGRITMRN